jgi:hypothetical protein
MDGERLATSFFSELHLTYLDHEDGGSIILWNTGNTSHFRRGPKRNMINIILHVTILIRSMR